VDLQVEDEGWDMRRSGRAVLGLSKFVGGLTQADRVSLREPPSRLPALQFELAIIEGPPRYSARHTPAPDS
jgi:hypothetical protein